MDVKSAIEYVPAQSRDKLCTNLPDLLVIIFMRSQSILPSLWYKSAKPFCSFLELSVVLNWHNTRDDRNVNSDSSNIVYPLFEYIEIVEHLSKDESSACIHLSLHMSHFNIFALSIWMTFRETSDCNIEVIAVLLSDELD